MAFALLAFFGLSVVSAAAFAVMFGMCNGLITIARGAVPLALFGGGGYGHLMGRIGGPFLTMQAIAPLVLPSWPNARPIRRCSRWWRPSRPWAFVAFIAIRPPKAAR